MWLIMYLIMTNHENSMIIGDFFLPKFPNHDYSWILNLINHHQIMTNHSISWLTKSVKIIKLKIMINHMINHTPNHDKSWLEKNHDYSPWLFMESKSWLIMRKNLKIFLWKNWNDLLWLIIRYEKSQKTMLTNHD